MAEWRTTIINTREDSFQRIRINRPQKRRRIQNKREIFKSSVSAIALSSHAFFFFSPFNRYISLHFSPLKFMIAFILLMLSLYTSIFYWSIIDIQYHFQVCILVIWYLYTFLKWSQQCPVNICHHTNLWQSCWLYSLCCTLHLCDLIFFITRSLSLSIPFTHFSCPHNTLPLEPPFCSLWVCFVCFGFWIPCVWKFTW